MSTKGTLLRLATGAGLAVACGVGLLAAGTSPAFAEEGWITRSGSTYYYEGGTVATGERYLRGTDGVSGWYYFDPGTGAMVREWQHLDSSGGKWVYYDPSTGRMAHGEAYVGGSGGEGWCYFDEVTGATQYGWRYVTSNGGKWVYYDPVTGRMHHGESWVTGSGGDGWCYFDDVTGATTYGWKWVASSGGKWVYYDPSTGRMWHGEGYVAKDNATTDDPMPGWCYFDDVTGATQYGWKRLSDGRVVYYDPVTGRMWHGSAVINGVRISLNSSTGAVELGAQWIQGAHFNHGTKTQQKYIMLHDTEGGGSPSNVAYGWMQDNQGAVAAHFVIGRDGSIVQCGGLDQILHHAGWGGPGNYDAKFGVGSNNGRGTGDDMYGVQSLSGYTSYGMNSFSIGIELVHVNGQDYTEAQLNKLDQVITYIDAYYGFKSQIIRHRDWRPSNSDTDERFDAYFNNYVSLRRHD